MSSDPEANLLSSPERQKYLTAIDRLRDLGLNEEVSLPQLVVVGDQSSGKSSLLEALTGHGFPVASDLCTRFATQIVMKRASQEYVTFSIIASHDSRSDESTTRAYEGFRHTVQGSHLSHEDLESALRRATFLMGLPSTLEESAEPDAKRFSSDLFKVEISGPTHLNLSVVDVPGLFHNPTKFQTASDKDIIKNMIQTYLKDKRTITLAVMDARNNLANQEVFELARSVDPEGLRTVAVITKCDALQAGDEEMVLRIAKNEVEYLRYGWFVVRNRSTQEIRDGVTLAQRQERERVFFSTEPWRQLSQDRRGIAALKVFLGNLLYEHIREEFPQVAQEVERLYSQARNELDALGPPRQTIHEQRQFLTKAASVYQQLVEDSLYGRYVDLSEHGRALKLRMHLRDLDDSFGLDMARRGHSVSFRTSASGVPSGFKSSRKTAESIDDWIRRQYRESRGIELPGMVNPSLVENLFRQQSATWEALAKEYKAKIQSTIEAFNLAALGRLIPEESMREALERLFRVTAESVGRMACDSLDLLLHDERGGILQTVNHYYADTLHRLQEERLLARFESLGMQEGQNDINLRQLLEVSHLSNEDKMVHDIHDILKAYYQVALKRFVDGVLLIVKERVLLGSQGALRVFTPEFVSGLDDAGIRHLAQEQFATTQARERLLAQVERLHRAVEIVRAI